MKAATTICQDAESRQVRIRAAAAGVTAMTFTIDLQSILSRLARAIAIHPVITVQTAAMAFPAKETSLRPSALKAMPQIMLAAANPSMDQIPSIGCRQAPLRHLLISELRVSMCRFFSWLPRWRVPTQACDINLGYRSEAPETQIATGGHLSRLHRQEGHLCCQSSRQAHLAPRKI